MPTDRAKIHGLRSGNYDDEIEAGDLGLLVEWLEAVVSKRAAAPLDELLMRADARTRKLIEPRLREYLGGADAAERRVHLRAILARLGGVTPDLAEGFRDWGGFRRRLAAAFWAPDTTQIEGEDVPSRIQQAIQVDPSASARVFAYLDERGEHHSGVISGATLAAVCGVDSRTWRRWVSGDRQMPVTAQRLLGLVSGLNF